LRGLEEELGRVGIEGRDLRYNLTWHDALNLGSLVTVGRAITAAAEARRESRGAHFREDFPATGDLAASAYSRVTMAGGEFPIDWQPVRFTRVKPGQTLLPA
jgi:fumarate reductase flavoprotein subunit